MSLAAPLTENEYSLRFAAWRNVELDLACCIAIAAARLPLVAQIPIAEPGGAR